MGQRKNHITQEKNVAMQKKEHTMKKQKCLPMAKNYNKSRKSIILFTWVFNLLNLMLLPRHYELAALRRVFQILTFNHCNELH